MHCHLRPPNPPVFLGFNHEPIMYQLIPNFNEIGQCVAKLLIDDLTKFTTRFLGQFCIALRLEVERTELYQTWRRRHPRSQYGRKLELNFALFNFLYKRR